MEKPIRPDLAERVSAAVVLRQTLEAHGATGLDVLEPRATSDGRGLGLFARCDIPPGYEISIPATLCFGEHSDAVTRATGRLGMRHLPTDRALPASSKLALWLSCEVDAEAEATATVEAHARTSYQSDPCSSHHDLHGSPVVTADDIGTAYVRTLGGNSGREQQSIIRRGTNPDTGLTLSHIAQVRQHEHVSVQAGMWRG